MNGSGAIEQAFSNNPGTDHPSSEKTIAVAQAVWQSEGDPLQRYGPGYMSHEIFYGNKSLNIRYHPDTSTTDPITLKFSEKFQEIMYDKTGNILKVMGNYRGKDYIAQFYFA